MLGIWWRGLTALGAACGLVVGGLLSGTAVTVAVAGGIDDDVLGGWPAVMIGYPAAVSVPLAFATMILVSRLTRAAVPARRRADLRPHARAGTAGHGHRARAARRLTDRSPLVAPHRPLTASAPGFTVSTPHASGYVTHISI